MVGEDNPRGTDPRLALFYLPRGASGDRLRRIMGLPDHAYHALRRVNLCDGPWTLGAARARALEILLDHDVLVLLGNKVRRAFGGPAPFEVARTPYGRLLVGLPHPSGRNRAWNEPCAASWARRLLASAAPWIAWGSARD